MRLFSWLDQIAINWLGRRHGWPIWAGRNLLYEPDEPLEDIQRAWDEAEKGYTAPPPAGIDVSDLDLSTIVTRDNRIAGATEAENK